MKKLLAGAGNLIFIMVTLYLCYFIVSAAYNRTPAFFGYRVLRVITDSMEPVFASGDCIIIKGIGEDELAVGDIITFISGDPSLNGAYNTHRIYDIAGDYTTGETIYFTKGDNNVWTDEYTVSEDDIVGKYIGKLPYGKTLSRFLDKLAEKDFYFVAIILPIVLCLTSCVVQLIKEVGRAMRKRGKDEEA